MNERFFTIYAMRCKENGKIYIGRTETTVRERILLHLQALKRGKHNSPTLQEDFNKYGKEAFEYYEIENNICFENREKESYYMDLYRTCNPQYGYNCKDHHNKVQDDFDIIHGKPVIPN